MSRPDEPVRAGARRFRITLTLEWFEDFHWDPAATDDENIEHARFYVEENHCLSNYARELVQMEADHAKAAGVNGICATCCRAEAELGDVMTDQEVAEALEIAKAAPTL